MGQELRQGKRGLQKEKCLILRGTGRTRVEAPPGWILPTSIVGRERQNGFGKGIFYYISDRQKKEGRKIKTPPGRGGGEHEEILALKTPPYERRTQISGKGGKSTDKETLDDQGRKIEKKG